MTTVTDSLQDGRKIPPFVMIEHAVFGRLAPNVFIVYAAIIKHADRHTRCSYPGHKLLAEECRSSVSTVKRAIAVLEREKLIKVSKKGWRFGQKNGRANLYTVLSPTAAKTKSLAAAKTKGKTGGVVHNELGGSSHRAGGVVHTELLTRTNRTRTKEQEKSLPQAEEGKKTGSKNQTSKNQTSEKE